MYRGRNAGSERGPAGSETGAGGAATLAVSWDGRDESGRDVPAGLYFVRVTRDGRTQTEKVVLLK